MDTFFRLGCLLTAGAAVLVPALSTPANSATLCVNPAGAGGCYASIQSAVNHASANDVINVARGIYKEGVVIGIPLSLNGAGGGGSTIDAAGHPNGVLIDGFNHPGLSNVTVKGFTVENALFEGILAVSANNVIISNNQVINNDTSPGLNFTGELTGCPGQPAYETDETGDCGGAIHLIGTSNSTVSGNTIAGNADGLLLSDETAVSQNNLVTQNTVVDNPKECGIVLASHPPVGAAPPNLPAHHGVIGNTIQFNLSQGNGVQVGGSGVGLFSDGAGPGTVANNTIQYNILVGNGLGGIALHTHVGPAFGAPADNMSNNKMIGNYIAGNLADLDDTATPGSVGINLNSGGGGSPINGTVITGNIISDEDVDVAINTPAPVALHQNSLLGRKIGVANVCMFDHATICTGSIDATNNYWGCPGGPGAPGCTSINPAYSQNITFTPFLTQPPPF
ncbi:MAG TPA: right-handed parallel beta-helix repeat-containing protein [Bryobacteraceae bacterium]|jgi:parallel beta-helix repeat protein|nr:right-handed parallel beta-helix repeat-containing protein [Bryobacteraceae bacterium]